ncbi:MAG: single-stranded-DNA-specific exonuclease RecJ [Fibrobacter sp.]|nr:single-stranded-DNA-specific exonuclease RecJ [Fibrobacter sp.]
MSWPGTARERVSVKNVDSAIVQRLKTELNVPDAIAAILAGRKLETFESCRAFFRPDISQFHDPFLFRQMEISVERILLAIDRKEKIAVYGDYDVDGITSTVLLIRVLRSLGADCFYFLPNRLVDGYGISISGIEQVVASGAKLIISVDCGITSNEEVRKAKSLGIDMIITDHHEPKDDLPDAFSILDPKVESCGYPDSRLAGVGVALKLCQGLGVKTARGEQLWKPYLDIAALGTAADIVPLTGENRIIASLGFKMMPDTQHKGLRELIAQQGLQGKKITTSQVVFGLAPCINAVGRLGNPNRGVELLLTDNDDDARRIATELREANLERRSLDSTVAEEACRRVIENCSPENDFVLVLGDQNWHAGVIGIVASKLVEKFFRPTVLFSIGPDGLAKGSGRSVPGLHLLDALSGCADLLEGFGGHAAAAGVSIKSENIDAFRERFNSCVASLLSPEDLTPSVVADAEIDLPQITPKFYRIVKEMEPFGPGNMRPVLFCRGLKHKYPPRIVGKNHLKLAVNGDGIVMDAIGFNLGERIDDLRRSEAVSLAFSLDENEWNGKTCLQMKLRGISL